MRQAGGAEEAFSIPESIPTSPEAERGLCVRAGAQCYLCERPIQEGDLVAVYHDTRFWEQALVYHAACWQGADLPAKAYPESVSEAPAIELPETAGCSICGEPIEDGDSVVRAVQVKRRRGGKVVHGRCFEARPHL